MEQQFRETHEDCQTDGAERLHRCAQSKGSGLIQGLDTPPRPGGQDLPVTHTGEPAAQPASQTQGQQKQTDAVKQSEEGPSPYQLGEEEEEQPARDRAFPGKPAQPELWDFYWMSEEIFYMKKGVSQTRTDQRSDQRQESGEQPIQTLGRFACHGDAKETKTGTESEDQ